MNMNTPLTIPPDAILKDFNTLLDWIEREGVIPVTPNQTSISITLLPHLNTLMKHPITIDLKRPGQQAFPHLRILFMLLRGSGLGLLKQVGKKAKLSIDTELRKQWDNLSPTEQYFTLLQTALKNGAEEIIGERATGFAGIIGCLTWLEKNLQKTIQFQEYKQQLAMYSPQSYAIAFMELFGLLKVEHGKPETGKGWRILSMRVTTFGKTLSPLLFQAFQKELMSDNYDNSDENNNWLQLHLKHKFPSWKNSLKLPKAAKITGSAIFKVSWQKSWRKIIINTSENLDTLSYAITQAFDFDFDHLYCFELKDRCGIIQKFNHPAMEEDLFTDETRIQDLDLTPGQQILFTFDFGDWWEFLLTFEEVQPKKQKKAFSIIEKKGQAPEQYPDYDEDYEDEFEFDESDIIVL